MNEFWDTLEVLLIVVYFFNNCRIFLMVCQVEKQLAIFY